MKKTPTHIGIIMDGNGRWAKAHGVPRVMGHNAGMQSMKKIVIATSDMGIKYLTVYAFSTENWKRSTEEVSGIFNLIVKYVNSELEELDQNNVHINIFGDYSMLPQAGKTLVIPNVPLAFVKSSNSVQRIKAIGKPFRHLSIKFHT